MVFTPQFIAEANRELARIETAKTVDEATHAKKMAKYNAQIERLRGILQADAEEAGNKATSFNFAGPDEKTSFEGVGMRDAVRTVLQESGRPMSRPEIQSILLERGFVPKGATRLTVQLGNELYRLVNQNRLTKRGGQFMLATSPNGHGDQSLGG